MKKFPWRFTLLTFMISWTLWALIAASGLRLNEDALADVAFIAGGFGPALAAIILLAARGTPQEMFSFWRRILDVGRIPLLWWGVALLLYPLTIAVAYLIVGLLSPDSVSRAPLDAFLEQSAPAIVLNILYIAIVGPISEEPGWRGYALDRLLAEWSPFVASLILGVVWWAWHLPLLAVQGSFLNVSGGDPTFIAGYLGTVVLYSILFTWVYQHTERSILSAILMHFSVNLTTGILAPAFEVFMVTTFLLIAICALIIVRERMWRSQPTETAATLG